jgi:hypothetical protein
VHSLALRELQKQVAFKAINIEYLVSLSEIGESGNDLVIELIYIYLESAPLAAAKAVAALRAHDLRSFKGSLAKLEFGSERIGARKMAELCHFLRDEVSIADPETISEYLDGMERELEQIEHELSIVANLLSSFHG